MPYSARRSFRGAAATEFESSHLRAASGTLGRTGWGKESAFSLRYLDPVAGLVVRRVYRLLDAQSALERPLSRLAET